MPSTKANHRQVSFQFAAHFSSKFAQTLTHLFPFPASRVCWWMATLKLGKILTDSHSHKRRRDRRRSFFKNFGYNLSWVLREKRQNIRWGAAAPTATHVTLLSAQRQVTPNFFSFLSFFSVNEGSVLQLYWTLKNNVAFFVYQSWKCVYFCQSHFVIFQCLEQLLATSEVSLMMLKRNVIWRPNKKAVKLDLKEGDERTPLPFDVRIQAKV